jgi:hypothetical protein
MNAGGNGDEDEKLMMVIGPKEAEMRGKGNGDS